MKNRRVEPLVEAFGRGWTETGEDHHGKFVMELDQYPYLENGTNSDGTPATIVDGDKVITTRKTIHILFSYRLVRPTWETFISDTGFTLKDLWRSAYEGYKRLYATPDMIQDWAQEAGIGILWFEGMVEVKPGYWHLEMGS